MNTHMEYEWFESLTFIFIVSFFWFLLIPVPIAVYLVLRRLEKQQLSRLIIAKILGIDHYRTEIAILKNEEYEEQFELEFEISEMAYIRLSKTHETLRKTYDRLVFEGILERRVQMESEKVHPDIHHLVLEDLMEESEKEIVMKEKKQAEEPKKERIRPVVKKNRVVIEEEDLFSSDDDNTF